MLISVLTNVNINFITIQMYKLRQTHRHIS